MIHNSLIAATLALAGTTTITAQAMAQSIDVPFTGVVRGTCSFNNLVPGVMVSSGSNILDTKAPGGSSGAVTVICNQPADLLVSDAVQTAGPSFVAGKIMAEAASSNGGTTNGSQSLFLQPGQSQVSVDIWIDSPAPLPSGNYGYNVSLTVVP
ncbi:MAG: hypothetical protein WA865_20915 [Spirulinaceae cyanobacterium]